MMIKLNVKESKNSNDIKAKTFSSDNGEFPIKSSLISTSVNPEMIAAIGASLSRDPATLEERVDRISASEDVAERIMSRFFRDYGHNSVGEMGTLNFSFEEVSMFAALMSICFPTFRGQEASTRYIKWDGEILRNAILPTPLKNNPKAEKSIEICFKLYEKVRDDLIKHYVENESMSEKQALPRALDVAGAFLPVATKTSVFVTASIRDLIEHSKKLATSESSEVEYVGKFLLSLVDKECPNSVKDVDDEEIIRRKTVRNSLSDATKKNYENEFRVDLSKFNKEAFVEVLDLMVASRYFFEENFVGHLGTITVHGTIDFRSMRDVWRHRPFLKRFNLNHKLGMAEWYLDELPPELRIETEEKIKEIEKYAGELAAEGVRECDLAYILPMGFKIHISMTGSANHWMYFLYLRSGVKVHPTVRHFVFDVANGIADELGIPVEHLLSSMSKYSDYGQRSKDA